MGGCERPPVETLQGGYRGLGMEQVINPRLDAIKAAKNLLPAPIPPAPAGGPPATSVYKNVQVLTDLNVAEFTRVMAGHHAMGRAARSELQLLPHAAIWRVTPGTPKWLRGACCRWCGTLTPTGRRMWPIPA